MKSLHALVASAMLAIGIVGCENPRPYMPEDLPVPITKPHKAESKSKVESKSEPGPSEESLPPKEETFYNYSKIKKSNGDYVVKRRSRVIKDSPPKIEIEAELDHFKVKVRNEGLNADHLEYIAVIDLEKGIVSIKNEFDFYNPVCNLDEDWERERNGAPTWEYCVFKGNELEIPKILGTYKYVVEVKDHYHTVRSEPFTIRIEEAK